MKQRMFLVLFTILFIANIAVVSNALTFGDNMTVTYFNGTINLTTSGGSWNFSNVTNNESITTLLSWNIERAVNFTCGENSITYTCNCPSFDYERLEDRIDDKNYSCDTEAIGGLVISDTRELFDSQRSWFENTLMPKQDELQVLKDENRDLASEKGVIEAEKMSLAVRNNATETLFNPLKEERNVLVAVLLIFSLGIVGFLGWKLSRENVWRTT